MILNDNEIDKMINGCIISTIAEQRGVSLGQAREILSEMTFLEHMKMLENVVEPPSGKQVGSKPVNANQPNNTPSKPDGDATAQAKMWSNPSAPITAGMTVGVTNDGGAVMPMQVSQVDQNASGVKVKDLTTGKEEWYNKDQLATMGMTAESDDADIDNDEDTDGNLNRILELAGVKEMASMGASCAGAIASAPASMGSTRKRSEESVSLDSEHKRDDPYKSIIGDTKPAQASGQLSANLAASGKPTARRTPRK